jgi:hypothetical protein
VRVCVCVPVYVCRYWMCTLCNHNGIRSHKPKRGDRTTTCQTPSRLPRARSSQQRDQATELYQPQTTTLHSHCIPPPPLDMHMSKANVQGTTKGQEDSPSSTATHLYLRIPVVVDTEREWKGNVRARVSVSVSGRVSEKSQSPQCHRRTIQDIR